MADPSITIKQLPFRVGDKVRYPKGIAVIQAIGEMRIGGKHSCVMYRLWRGSYWHGWQLQLIARGQ